MVLRLTAVLSSAPSPASVRTCEKFRGRVKKKKNGGGFGVGEAVDGKD